MKIRLQFTLLVLLTGLMTRAQVSGTYDIPGTPYPTIASAIAALNVAGVGTGGVTFNIAAGYTETFMSSTAGHITYGNGTAANPIVFQKSGTGANPVITAGTGILALRDIIICLKGTSYVTFDGIDLRENPANLDPLTRTEWGYAILKDTVASLPQGSWHNTIKNCAVSLAGDYLRTWAVYLNNITPDTVEQLPVYYASGTSSFNTISGLTITNCVGGIRLQGFNDPVSPWTFYDQNNTVTGNTITLTGGGLSAGEQPKGLYIWYTNNLDVSYNTVNGTIPATSLAPQCITLGYANGASWDCYENSVSVTYLGSTGTFVGIQSTPYGELGTNNTTSFHHNRVRNCSYPKAGAASSGNFSCMNIGMGVTSLVYDNAVTNNTMGDGTTAAGGEFRGMVIYKGTLVDGPTAIYNNVVSGNSRLQSTPANSTNSYMYVNFSTYPGTYDMLLDIHNNTIENNTTTSTGFMDLLRLQCAVGTKCHHNIIRNNTGGGTINGIFSGMNSGLGGINPVYEIYNNRVENLTSTISNNQAYFVNGLTDNVSGCPNYWYNNFISGLKAPNSQSANAVVAANFAVTTSGTNTNYFYNNTIFLDAASSSLSNFGSTGVSTIPSKKLEMKNNIIVNTSVFKGTGKTVALRFSGPVTTVNYLAESNNNLFYCGTPGPNNLIYFDGTNSDQTLAAFQSRVAPRDNSSVTELPPFVNVTISPYDLHLATNVGTQCESGGIDAITSLGKIAVDYDGEARFPFPGYPVNPSYPATAPDLGADEFGGMPADITPPGIAFTPLANTSLLTPATLTATIADPSGVPTSGTGLPRLYWKINQGGSWNTSVASWVTGSIYTFSLGASAVLNDSVYYYIVAQDMVTPPNVGSKPAVAGCTANPPACPTPPSNSLCFAYKIVGGMCGVYTVGAGQNYPTLTAAVADLNMKHITCPVELHLTDASYTTETLPIVINTINGASATNTITIRPAPGVNAVISGTTTSAILKLSKARYIIIDGSNNGTSSRNLTISNTGTSGSTAVIWIASQGTEAGSTNDVIKNCNISNGYRAGNAFAILIGGSAINTFTGGDDNDNITIRNNAISKSTYGIYAMANATGFLDNLVIADNIIGSDIPASYLSSKGILINSAIAAQVTGNEIYNFIGTLSKTGIEMQRSLLNTLVKENKIHDFQMDANSAGGSIGINAGTGSDVINTTLVNNLIYNLTTTNLSTTSFTTNPFGIKLTQGSGYKLYNNTVRLAGTQAAYTTPSGTLSSALLIMAATIADMRNNIFANSLEGLAGSKSYCIYMDENSVFPTITSTDYNDFWPSGTFGILGRYADINTMTGTDLTSLPAWQAASGKDANSISADPVFTSPSNLKPTNYTISKKGIQVTGVTIDFVQVIRTNPPDIGAYEFGITATTAAATGIAGGQATLNGSVLSNAMTVTTFFDYGSTTAYGQTVAATPSTVSGTAAQNISSILNGLQPGTYHFRARAVTPGNVDVNGQDLIFSTGIPENTTVQNITVANGQTTCYNATQTLTIAGGGTTFTVENGGSATMIAGQNIFYLPGTTVAAGGYMLGHITQTNEFCSPVPLPTAPLQTGAGENPAVSMRPGFRVYPNPTNGSFTIERTGAAQPVEASLEIYGISGNRVMKASMSGAAKQVVSLEDQPTGLYFIRLISDGTSATMKIIKE